MGSRNSRSSSEDHQSQLLPTGGSAESSAAGASSLSSASSTPTRRPSKRQRGDGSTSIEESASTTSSTNNNNNTSRPRSPQSRMSTDGVDDDRERPVQEQQQQQQQQQDDVETLHHDLAEVERGLTQQRNILYSSSTSGVRGGGSHGGGNAVFESFGSALRSIRSRFQELTGSVGGGAAAAAVDGDPSSVVSATSDAATPITVPSPLPRPPSVTLRSISDRLATAERAHSTRMPLGLLQTELSRQRSMGESGGNTSIAATANDTVRRETSMSSLTTDPSSETRRRRTSVLVASRRNTEIHELNDVEVIASSLMGDDFIQPMSEEQAESSSIHSSSRPMGKLDDVEEIHAEDDIGLLLPESALEQSDTVQSPSTSSVWGDAGDDTKTQQYAYHHKTGTLQVLSPPTSPGRMEMTSPISSVEDVTPEPTTTTTTTTTPEFPPIYVWGSLNFVDEESDHDVEESGTEGGCHVDDDEAITCKPSNLHTYEILGGGGDVSNDQTVLESKSISKLDDASDSIPVQLPSTTRLGRSNIVSVGISSTHMAFATATGSLLICGDNSHGAVDPSQKSVPSIPRPMHMELLALNRILTVSCGTDHTAAIAETRSVLTWGSNRYGQLGHRNVPNNRGIGDHHDFVLPKAMQLTGQAAQVACGDGFTLVLTTEMTLFMCGREEITGYNALEAVVESSPSGITGNDRTPPLMNLPDQNPALRGLPLVYVAAGSTHAVVLTAHGTAYVWGSNEYGQCGREYPKRLTVPVPIAVPKTTKRLRTPSISRSSDPLTMAAWDVGTTDGPISLANDVNIIHAACGKDHTVLVTKAGQLLVCGSNANRQLSPAINTPAFPSLQVVQHPVDGKMFVSAEAGCYHTVMLDESGHVWELISGQLKEVVSPHSWSPIRSIAAGGPLAVAIAQQQDTTMSNSFDTKLRVDHPHLRGLDTLMEAIQVEDDQTSTNPQTVVTTDELARRTEDLFRSVAVMNSLFMNPNQIDELYHKLIHGGRSIDVQQVIVTAMEKGMVQGLESLKEARLIYPEAIRILLLFLQCPLLKEPSTIPSKPEEEITTKQIQFDVRGNMVLSLCETILDMPFEGYKAFLAWTTTVYGQDHFVPHLVKPLIVQLNNRLEKSWTYGIPLIAGVLRWLFIAVDRSEGHLAKPEDFYCSGLDEHPIESLFEDLARFKRANKADRSVNFYFAAYSFLMSPSIKRNLLQVENQLGMVQAAQSGVVFDVSRREFLFKPYFVLEIDRKYLLQQTLQAVAQASPGELRKSLKIVFKGEDGVDAGGVTKEFFQLLVQKLFDVNTGMWSTRFGYGNQTWFNSDCTWNDDGYYLVGVLTGLAFYNSAILDVHFPPAVYRKLLGLPLGLEDMVDEDVGKGLKSLLEYAGDDVEDICCLNFEVTWMDLGIERKIELKPGGAGIPVTSDNKEEYVLLYVKWLLVDSIAKQYEEFERGFLQVVEGSSLELLRAEELELLVVGTTELDFVALEANTQYEGGFDSDSPVIKNLWRYIQSAPLESQLKFLKFCTGSGKAPIGGLGELPFKIQRAGPDSMQLPTSHTCFNTLLLPDYSDYDKLVDRLGRAVIECEGFGLQ